MAHAWSFKSGSNLLTCLLSGATIVQRTLNGFKLFLRRRHMAGPVAARVRATRHFRVGSTRWIPGGGETPQRRTSDR